MSTVCAHFGHAGGTILVRRLRQERSCWDLLLTMSIPGRNSTAATLVSTGFVVVLVLVNVSGFRPVLARGRRRGRTISLGSLSHGPRLTWRLADLQPPVPTAREWPRGAARTQPIGHAPGTPVVAGSWAIRCASSSCRAFRRVPV